MHAWYDQVIALVRELALQFVMTGDGPGATTRVAIVTFASSAVTLTPLSGDTNVVLAALEQSLAAGTHGFTNISDGLVAGATALAELAARPSAERVLLLLTDGEQSPQFGGTAAAAMQAAKLRAEGIQIHAWGFDGSREDALRAIASEPATRFVGFNGTVVELRDRFADGAFCARATQPDLPPSPPAPPQAPSPPATPPSPEPPLAPPPPAYPPLPPGEAYIETVRGGLASAPAPPTVGCRLHAQRRLVATASMAQKMQTSLGVLLATPPHAAATTSVGVSVTAAGTYDLSIRGPCAPIFSLLLDEARFLANLGKLSDLPQNLRFVIDVAFECYVIRALGTLPPLLYSGPPPPWMPTLPPSPPYPPQYPQGTIAPGSIFDSISEAAAGGTRGEPRLRIFLISLGVLGATLLTLGALVGLVRVLRLRMQDTNLPARTSVQAASPGRNRSRSLSHQSVAPLPEGPAECSGAVEFSRAQATAQSTRAASSSRLRPQMKVAFQRIGILLEQRRVSRRSGAAVHPATSTRSSHARLYAPAAVLRNPVVFHDSDGNLRCEDSGEQPLSIPSQDEMDERWTRRARNQRSQQRGSRIGPGVGTSPATSHSLETRMEPTPALRGNLNDERNEGSIVSSQDLSMAEPAYDLNVAHNLTTRTADGQLVWAAPEPAYNLELAHSLKTRSKTGELFWREDAISGTASTIREPILNPSIGLGMAASMERPTHDGLPAGPGPGNLFLHRHRSRSSTTLLPAACDTSAASPGKCQKHRHATARGTPSKEPGMELSSTLESGSSKDDSSQEHNELVSTTGDDTRKAAYPFVAGACRVDDPPVPSPSSSHPVESHPKISRAEPEHSAIPDAAASQHLVPASRVDCTLVSSASQPSSAGTSAQPSAIRWACDAQPRRSGVALNNQRHGRTADACRNQVMDFDD